MINKKSVKNILVLRTERIGDYALTIPALKMLRENFPKAKIDIVVLPIVKNLANATPYVDNVFTFSNPLIETTTRFDVAKKYLLNYFKLRKFGRRFSSKNYDLVVNFSNRKIGEILFDFIDGEYKISQTRDYGEINESSRMVRVLKEAGLKVNGKRIKLKVSNEDKKFIRKIIGKRGKDIVIHPFTYLEAKNWSEEKWIELIKEIFLRKNFNIYLIGEGKDFKRCQEILKKVASLNLQNLCGRFNLLQTMEFIDKCDLYIGVDSGPMHLAELTTTPIIALFGYTNEKIWGPEREKDRTIKRKTMDDIGVMDVLEKANIT